MDDTPSEPAPVSWPALMEAMLIGAVRGMAEAHAQLQVSGGSVPALNELSMFQVAELMTALFLEESTDYSDPASWPKGAEKVSAHILTHLGSFRRQRERSGEPTLFRILERAGLDRHRAQ